MGCGESRVSTPFREKNNEVSWYISNAQWKEFVETTYTEEYVNQADVGVDCYQLWKDMNQTEVDGKYVVGRACFIGKDFVSFGRVLVTKPYWHSYQGIYSSDDLFFGSGQKEDYEIKLDKDGTLVCKPTGNSSSQDQINASVAFQGQGRKLFDDGDDAPKGQKLGDDPAEPKEDAAPAEEKKDENPDRLCWRKTKDGKMEVFVKSTQTWAECEIQFDNYEQIVIVHDGKQVGGFKRDITQIPLEERKFDGADMVFGEITTRSEVDNEKNAKWMSLHASRVDDQKKLLQVVCTLGKSLHGQPRVLTCPIPVNKLSAVKEVIGTYRQWTRPMYYQGRMLNDKEIRDFMITWMMVDIAVTVACYAVFAAMMAESASYGAEAAMFGAADAGEAGGLGFSLFDFL